jgi:hypothetical protein
MKELFMGVICGLGFSFTVILCVTFGEVMTYDRLAAGELKVYTWSNINDLNAELAKGWEVQKAYNMTNVVLRKKSKE